MRPATTRPASTGPEFPRQGDHHHVGDRALGGENREKPVQLCSASTMPEKIAVNPTTGRE